jgi:crotonobetainyl-CoA:carnitine CoA-transferase CaiB-like acyl-CoA transferase
MAAMQGTEAAPRTMPVSAIDYVSGYLMAFGAMVALGRRAREGGSWHVQVSLARTGQWIVEHGLVDAEALGGACNELAEHYLAQITQCTQSSFGLIRHLSPAAQMSATPPRWERPPVPLGHDAAQWL